MKIKTADLKGDALDYAVGIAHWGPDGPPLGLLGVDKYGFGHRKVQWQPSTRWDQGGHIIEIEKLSPQWSPLWKQWIIPHPKYAAFQLLGPTALIAAMRCYVASRMGDEVEIPEELA